MGRLVAAATVVIAAMVTTGCSHADVGGHGGSTPTPGGDLVVARSSDVISLDPIAFSDNPSIFTSQLISETLIKPSVDGKTLVSGLAESWKLNGTGNGYDFTLRKGVKFSDGKPMTADDVVYSLRRNLASKGPMSFLNYKDTTITKTSDTVVSVSTDKPYGPLLSLIALYSNAVVPLDLGGKSDADFAKSPIGTGPFQLTEWKKGQYIKLAKNPNYWSPGKPYLDSVTFTVVSDDNTRQTQLLGNQVQMNESPSYSSIANLKQQAGITVGMYPSSLTTYLAMNNAQPPFQDRAVRRAIAQAIDRKSLVEAAVFGYGEPANTYLPNVGIWGHDDSAQPLAYSIDAAKKELASSSQPNGFDTTLLIRSGSPTGATLAQIIQQDLAQINIKVTIQTLDGGAATAAMDKGSFGLAFTNFTTDVNDPAELAGLLAVYDPTQSCPANCSFWKSPDIGPILDVGLYNTDQAARLPAYTKAQELVNKEAPFVPLFYSSVPYSMSNSVHGFESMALGGYTMADTWLSK